MVVRWMYGWMDRWMDGWKDSWMDGWKIVRFFHGWMDGWMNVWMDVYLDGWMDSWKDGWLDSWMDDRRMDWWMDKGLNPLLFLLFQSTCHIPTVNVKLKVNAEQMFHCQHSFYINIRWNILPHLTKETQVVFI